MTVQIEIQRALVASWQADRRAEAEAERTAKGIADAAPEPTRTDTMRSEQSRAERTRVEQAHAAHAERVRANELANAGKPAACAEACSGQTLAA